ncbi:MAG: ATP-dependent Clp protease adaptor ClpS [Armatimonadetes bacterium]|nr:ATP-dependent Clp protease adaptor ClpS [Armatimonadota bacterium]
MRASSTPLLSPQTSRPGHDGGRYLVEIFNNDHTPVDMVLAVLMEATSCDLGEAQMEVWEAEHFGKAAVHFAGENKCHQVAAVIESVGVQTEVRREWDD